MLMSGVDSALREKAIEHGDGKFLISGFDIDKASDATKADPSIMDLLAEKKRLEQTMDPVAQYKRLAGEEEARAVPKRLKLTPDERAARPAWLDFDSPMDEQIVRYGDGPAMSELPMDEASRMARAREMGFGDDLYHASRQDIDEFVPGYDDGLTFVTDNPEMANTWLGKGKYRQRLGAEDEIQAAEDAYRAAKHEAMDYESLNGLKGDAFNQLYDERSAAFRAANPVRPEDSYSAVYPVRSNVKKTFDPRTDYKEIEDFLLQRGNGMDELVKQGKHKAGNWVIYENADVVAELKRRGYDSMMIAENIDGPHETLAIFDPKNIRSKFAKFDPAKKDSANILASLGGLGLLGAAGLYQPESAPGS
jgi:hypothetical protein